MLSKDTIAVCDNHAEHMHTLCGQNVEFFNIKGCGTYCNHLL
jgi:hypothetical protein